MSRTERNEIRCYRSPKIEVRNSDLEGRGVFAVAKIQRGNRKVIFVFTARPVADFLRQKVKLPYNKTESKRHEQPKGVNSFIWKGKFDMMLEGKTAIITGGGAGVGAAIAARFVAEGAKICIVGRRENVLDRMIQTLPPGTAVKCRGDVSEPSDIAPIVNTALTFGGTIDVLVNNAGVGTGGTVTDVSVSEWRKTIEINLVGPFMLMREVIPHMMKSGGGSIVNISSIASLRSVPLDSAYCTSKAGLNALTQQAALDYGKDGIRCNIICPGFVFSDMSEEHFGQAAEDLGTDLSTFMTKVFHDIPSHKPATPDKIAGICAFLAGDDSSYITGAVIPVDGGLAIMDPFPLCVKNAGLEMSRKN